MRYQIESVDFFVRETPPARFRSALGKKGRSGQRGEKATSPLCHVRVRLRDARGNRTFGCAADRLSVRWLDKRPGRGKALKLRELTSLLEWTGKLYAKQADFDSPFAQWRRCHPAVVREGRRRGQVGLTSAFASALLERAVIDGVCRLEKKPLYQMVRNGGLGLEPAAIHPQLKGLAVKQIIGPTPNTEIFIRHTIGLFDPLTAADLPAEERPRDGLPETVDDYIQREGIRYFKVKISGDIEADLKRLARVWEVVASAPQPSITLDANEAYDDLNRFDLFIRRLEKENLGLFQHILYVEQPLPRGLALNPKAAQRIADIARRKPLIIDESDDAVDAFKRAHAIGYVGTSHKNCKGFFKSILNQLLAAAFALSGKEALLSGEDLQNLPVVPLQQDFVTVGILGLQHCERNGHHYNFGLSMLSDKDKQAVTRRHPDLYEKRGNEWFLRINQGLVRCASLHGPGFGVQDEPDWPSMTSLDRWIRTRYPV